MKPGTFVLVAIGTQGKKNTRNKERIEREARPSPKLDTTRATVETFIDTVVFRNIQ